MPKLDGTGPAGCGPGTGRGRGSCSINNKSNGSRWQGWVVAVIVAAVIAIVVVLDKII